MASQAAFSQQREALGVVVRAWERRARAQQALRWLPRGLWGGLALGIGVALAARLFPVLSTGQAAAVAAAGAALAALTAPLLAWLRPRALLAAARRFDLEFNLGERTSTALELAEGRIRTRDDLAARQIADAWAAASAVDIRARLPLRADTRAWLLAAALAAVLVLLLLLPNPQAEAASGSAARDAALAQARDELADVTQEVAALSPLADDQRQALLEQLERAAETLGEQQVTAEEAFAALAGAQSRLVEAAAGLERQAGDSRAAAQQAASALRQAAPPPDAPPGQGRGEQAQQAIPTLEPLAQQIPQMSQQQRDEAAAALEAAADALQATNPAAADALREAAEALRRGAVQAAQNALRRAGDSLQAGQQQAERQQQAADQLNTAAQRLQQAANQIAQSQNPGRQTGQQQAALAQMEQGDEQQAAQGLRALSQQMAQQAGAEGQQGEAGAAGQGRESPASEGQQPGARGVQPVDRAQDDAAGSVRAVEPGGAGGGAGDQPGDAGDEAGGAAGRDRAAATNNQPDGAGARDYAPVYAPQRVGGAGGPQIVLEPDAGDAPAVEGEFAPNPAGQALVPYSQVFSDYSQAASRALDSAYIPLGMRDIVRDYFSALEPRRSGGE